MVRSVNTNLISGILGLLVAALFWVFKEDLSRLSIVFPRAVLLIMTLVSIALVLKGITRPESTPVFAEGSNGRIVVAALVLIAWILAIPRLGFVVSSFLAFSFLAWYLASAHGKVPLRQLAWWLLVVAAEVVGLYLIFARVLHVPLPEGWFF